MKSVRPDFANLCDYQPTGLQKVKITRKKLVPVAFGKALVKHLNEPVTFGELDMSTVDGRKIKWVLIPDKQHFAKAYEFLNSLVGLPKGGPVKIGKRTEMITCGLGYQTVSFDKQGKTGKSKVVVDNTYLSVVLSRQPNPGAAQLAHVAVWCATHEHNEYGQLNPTAAELFVGESQLDHYTKRVADYAVAFAEVVPSLVPKA